MFCFKLFSSTRTHHLLSCTGVAVKNSDYLLSILQHLKIAGGFNGEAEVTLPPQVMTPAARQPPSTPSSPVARVSPPSNQTTRPRRPTTAQRVKAPFENANLLGATVHHVLMQMLNFRISPEMVEPSTGGNSKQASSHKDRLKLVYKAVWDATPEDEQKYLNVLMVPSPGGRNDMARQDARNEFMKKSQIVVTAGVTAVNKQYGGVYLSYLEQKHRNDQVRRGETPTMYKGKIEFRTKVGQMSSMIRGAQRIEKDLASANSRPMQQHFAVIPRRKNN